MLMVLRSKIRGRGLTQLEVQDRLGWGRSYISQLVTRQKSLRVEQLVLILEVIGVEPEGAPTLTKSLAAGEPQSIDAVRTIADSLGAPHAAPMSFGLIQDHVEEVVLVDDDAIRAALALLFSERKLATEPASVTPSIRSSAS